MRRTLLAVTVFLLALSHASGVTIKTVPLAEGRKEDNTLASAVINPSAPLELGTFVQEFPAGGPLHRKKTGGVIGGKSKTSPDLDLGSALAEALRGEAPRMGFELGPGGWKLGGVLKALYYDLRTNGWAMLYYGAISVDLEIVSPEGEVLHENLQLFNYDPEFAKYPLAVVAEMLVEGSQEILARLNVRHFKFPADPSVAKMMGGISAEGASRKDLECTAVGLSGSSDVVLPLLEVLKGTKDENDRGEIVDALARIEDARVIPVLDERYAREDEDVRWFTLKAMGYIGSVEAMKLVKEKGLTDRSKACRALAEDLLNSSGLVQPTSKRKPKG